MFLVTLFIIPRKKRNGQKKSGGRDKLNPLLA